MIEEGYRCANWSQSGLSRTKGCYLVVVTTKHRVLVYECSTKDPLNSDWQLVKKKVCVIYGSDLIPHSVCKPYGKY